MKKNKLSYLLQKAFLVFWCLVFTGLMAGCVTSKPQHIVPISEAKNLEGSAKNVDGTLLYNVNFSPEESGDSMGSLTVSGEIKLNQPLNSINIELSFLNAGGEVTEKQSIFSTLAMKGYHKTKYRHKELTFNKEVQVPKGTNALGFSLFAHDRPQRPGRGGK